MLYLLGELEAEQTATFEKRLESSPQLGAELLRQADVISTLSMTAPKPLPAPVSIRRAVRWPVVASIVAIAACIAIMMLGARPSTTVPPSIARLSESSRSESSRDTASVSEDLMIARAWATSQFNEVADDFGLVYPEFDDSIAVADDSSDIDSTLSWMFVAVSANVDETASLGATDG